ncbi:MAG: hypothetical protein ACI8RZ_003264 [Myxococcota bacterium]
MKLPGYAEIRVSEGSMADGTWWMRTVTAGLHATSEALYPENDFGAPDWRTVDLVPRCLAWMAELPPRQRDQLYLLFGAVELATPLLAPSLRRFSKLSVSRRLALVRRWRASRLLPLKLIADSLKATTSMMYLSHPAALTWIGMYKVCARPDDPLQVEIRPDALAVSQ